MSYNQYNISKDYNILIKLSKLTDYAVVILAEMAKGQGVLQTAVGLSIKTGLPEPTVAKVLKLMAKGKVIISTRGVNGGYILSQSPKDISMADVIVAVDGPVQLASCVDDADEPCSYATKCTIKGKWNPVNDAMKIALENITLAQMMEKR
jgi:FeS assembly SUF system regulator